MCSSCESIRFVHGEFSPQPPTASSKSLPVEYCLSLSSYSASHFTSLLIWHRLLSFPVFRRHMYRVAIEGRLKRVRSISFLKLQRLPCLQDFFFLPFDTVCHCDSDITFRVDMFEKEQKAKVTDQSRSCWISWDAPLHSEWIKCSCTTSTTAKWLLRAGKKHCQSVAWCGGLLQVIGHEDLKMDWSLASADWLSR